MPQYKLREFKVTDARDGSSRTIRQFVYCEWPEQGSLQLTSKYGIYLESIETNYFNKNIAILGVPKSGEGFIDFIGQVHKTKEQFGQDGPITVHCSAGVGRTGNLFVFLFGFDKSTNCDVLPSIRRCLHFIEYRPRANAVRRCIRCFPNCSNSTITKAGYGAD